ncbi:MAG: peptide-methionine (S)-S-oxide reductase MsrA [Kofleriaceae bacterium]
MRRLLATSLIAALASPAAAESRTETAIFAGGCFWSMEHDMEHIPGVISAVSGYTGGHLEKPTYQDVLKETTGHYEAIKITYDSAKISYRQLVDRYWHAIDPLDAGGAFCDRGDSYRTAIFVTPEQREIAAASKAAQKGPVKQPVATAIKDATTFWPAEAYHQDYAKQNPDHYFRYRKGCGKDARLKILWGARALK